MGSHGNAYLVKWHDTKYDDMCFESLYVIHHLAKSKIITYFLEQLELKKLTFLSHALSTQKVWRSSDKGQVV